LIPPTLRERVAGGHDELDGERRGAMFVEVSQHGPPRLSAEDREKPIQRTDDLVAIVHRFGRTRPEIDRICMVVRVSERGAHLQIRRRAEPHDRSGIVESAYHGLHVDNNRGGERTRFESADRGEIGEFS
jgi:hypothetical protein